MASGSEESAKSGASCWCFTGMLLAGSAQRTEEALGQDGPSASPRHDASGVQDTARWARWKARNQGHPGSILTLVVMVKEEGQRGTPGSPERVFDSILFWRCRFDFPSAGPPLLLL